MDANRKQQLIAAAVTAAEDAAMEEHTTKDFGSQEGKMICKLAKSLQALGLAVQEILREGEVNGPTLVPGINGLSDRGRPNAPVQPAPGRMARNAG